MDFNFGEINEPVSRAFYDDYDEPSLNLRFERYFHIFVHRHVMNFESIFFSTFLDQPGSLPAKMERKIFPKSSRTL